MATQMQTFQDPASAQKNYSHHRRQEDLHESNDSRAAETVPWRVSSRMPTNNKRATEFPNVSKRLMFPKISGPVSALSVMPNDNFFYSVGQMITSVYNNLYDEFTQETAAAKEGYSILRDSGPPCITSNDFFWWCIAGRVVPASDLHLVSWQCGKDFVILTPSPTGDTFLQQNPQRVDGSSRTNPLGLFPPCLGWGYIPESLKNVAHLIHKFDGIDFTK
ncbi:hypothetical protein JCM33374_g6668 [Metschnikowia sp. JCM 33374]|nr:hypothetical protein JCM33374_g6668 [Metschnikowia sp. JCM 33374]